MAESPVVPAGGGGVSARPGGGASAAGAMRSPALRLGRRRQANVAGGRSRLLKIKVTEAEAAQLADLARGAQVSVPRLLVEAAMAAGTGAQTSTERREAMAELFAVHRKLAGIAVNVNQVAKATNASGEAPSWAQWAGTLEAVRAVAARVDECVRIIGSEHRAAGRYR